MGRIALNERLMGYDSNGKKCIICDFICDSVSDLPTQTVYTDYVLMIGCTASMIDSGDIYKINSLGAWNLSQAGTGTYTKSEIDNLLTAKQNVLTFDNAPTEDSTNPVTSGGIWTDQQRQDTLQSEDRDALVEIVDGGAKNRFIYGDLIGITDNFTDKTFSLPAGNYKLMFALTASSGSFAIRLKDGEDNSIFYVRAYNTVGTRSFDVTLSTDAAKITVYSSVLNNFTNFMICTSAAWKISQSYQPYRPSWQEMYNMILALQ